ncbi:hypothetical protein CCR75_008012 [Bremia lactucae]|uniref:Uncharacterized protein n=1 Tax=Bremia lactucae TaxID=4779 RepID=A0A976FEX2_BRELC|nr:hypothetical protein CCR75_008012 [Bremia lactucae]
MNATKTERTMVARRSCSDDDQTDLAIEDGWRQTIKLGSELGDKEDISRRKFLATAAPRRLWTIWSRSSNL